MNSEWHGTNNMMHVRNPHLWWGYISGLDVSVVGRATCWAWFQIWRAHCRRTWWTRSIKWMETDTWRALQALLARGVDHIDHRYRALFVRLTSQPYASPGTQTWPSTKSTWNWRVWAPPCRTGPVSKWVGFVLRHLGLIYPKQVKRLIRERGRLLSGSNCIFNYSMGTGDYMLSQILIIQSRLISNLSKV